jgi:predicted aconitase
VILDGHSGTEDKMMTALDLSIELAQEERDILQGKQGPTMQKVMQTVVLYGQALGADRLVNTDSEGHFVIAYAIPGIAPSMRMLDELVDAGLKSKLPFTLDPKPPLDYENWFLSSEQVHLLEEMYADQPRYEERMLQRGLRGPDAWTCTPYLPQVGNRPSRGDNLAWSESACVIFANSVLGARTNRNGAIMDLLCAIIGKVPLAGLLTDEGRQATWLVEVRTERLPAPQLLGAAIGRRVLADVPFIVGLDRFLGTELSEEVWDYLHEMGAACATAGAVGLFHVERITPEARDLGRDLLSRDHRSYVIDDRELKDLLVSYPVLWTDKEAPPDKCFIGCPHLSLRQLHWWADRLHGALQMRGQSQLRVKTTFCAAPQVLELFRKDWTVCGQLQQTGARLSAGCPMQLFDNDLSAGEAIVTNSNKLRAYTEARFFPDDELVEILVSRAIGQVPPVD